jgi:hypothetical protein
LAKVRCPRVLCSKLFIAFGACAVFLSVHAPVYGQQPAAPPAPATGEKKIEWIKATVVTDGGAVYSEPDFDAKVAEYLSVKTPLWASRKAVPGHGGLGLFHRVHFQNKTGYMADVDIRVVDIKEAAEPPAAAAEKSTAKKQPKKIRSKALSAEEDEHHSEPPYFTRYVGGSLALTNFTEKFENKTFRSNMGMAGLRLTGPGVLFDGPPLDVNILFSPFKPGYYSQFSKSATGFLFFGDIGLTLPFIERNNWLWTYSLGLMYTYTQYKVLISSSSFDSREFRIGFDAGVGAAYCFGAGKHKPFAIRTDAKYYFEKTRYYGLLSSFQVAY